MGVILFLMLFGEFPFNGNSNNVIIDKILDGEYEMQKDIKKTLSRVCVDCIEKML
jgi:hypothetical protein